MDLPVRTLAQDLSLAKQETSPPADKNKGGKKEIKRAEPQKPALNKPQSSVQRTGAPRPPVNLPTGRPKIELGATTPPVTGPASQPGPKPLPVPQVPSQKKTKKQQLKQTARQFLAEGESLLQKKFYQEAKQQLNKVLISPGVSFWQKRHAQKLLKKAQRAVWATENKQISPARPGVSLPPVPPKPAKASHRQHIPQIILWTILAVAIIAGGWYFYFYYYAQRPAAEPPTTDNPIAQIQPAPAPDKIISGQFSEIIAQKNNNPVSDQIKESLVKELRVGFFKNLFFTKIEDFVERYLTLPEFLAATVNQIPADIQDRLTGRYNLLVYQQPESAVDSPFTSDPASNKRLLLLLEIKDGAGLAEKLTAWENSLPADLKGLYPVSDRGDAKTETFQENFYRGTQIRYLNFPEPDLSADYLMLGNLLILSTSRESTFAVIDKIMETL